MLDLKPLAESLESYARSLETYAAQIKSIAEILRSVEEQLHDTESAASSIPRQLRRDPPQRQQETDSSHEAKLPGLGWHALPVISDKLDVTPVIETHAAYAPTADDPLNPQAMWQRIVADRKPPPLTLPPPPAQKVDRAPGAALVAALSILAAAALALWSRLSQG